MVEQILSDLISNNPQEVALAMGLGVMGVTTAFVYQLLVGSIASSSSSKDRKAKKSVKSVDSSKTKSSQEVFENSECSPLKKQRKKTPKKSRKALQKEREAALKKAEKKRRQREKKLAERNKKKEKEVLQFDDGLDDSLGEVFTQQSNTKNVVSSPKKTQSKSKKDSEAARLLKKKKAECEKLLAQARADAEDGWSTAGVKRAQKVSRSFTNRVEQQRNEEYVVGGKYVAENESTAEAEAVKTAVKEYVTIPSKKIGHIIGPSGSMMKKIEEISKCRLNMPNRNRDDPYAVNETSKVQVEGEPSGIKIARRAILDLCNKGYSTLVDPNLFEGYVKVDPSRFHEIMGRGGATIRALQEKLNVRINVPKERHSQVSHRVMIVGEKVAVKKSKEVIRQLLAQHYTSITHPGFTHVEVNCPSTHYSLVIGERGQTIKSIEGDTKCKIHIPGKLDAHQNILIVGPAEKVEIAAKRVNKIVERGFEYRNRHYEDEGFED
eukprot:g40.t1